MNLKLKKTSEFVPVPVSCLLIETSEIPQLIAHTSSSISSSYVDEL